MTEEGYRPPADPAHPELGPSEYAASAMGYPSRLTDEERSLLTYLALRHVADELAIDDQEAADMLDGYADRGDPCQFVGDQRAVAIVAGGVELIRADRAWLRAMTTSGDGTQN
jgi:hypothetical protein